MYTRHNLGDTAIVQMISREIRARIPDCEFIGINRVPQEAVDVHHIPALHSSGYGTPLRADGSTWDEVDRPDPRWLSVGLGTRRILKVSSMLDLLLMTGGGQIEDFFGGPSGQPRALLTWVTIARALGVPVVFLSVGVDLLSRRSSRLLCVNAVRLAQIRSFRDQGSVDLLREAGLGAPCRVDPDPALGLDAGTLRGASWQDSDLIVVSPISYRTFTEAREDSYDVYLQHLLTACESWTRVGRRTRFVCSDIQMDPPVAEQLVSRLSETARRGTEVAHVDTVEGFLENVAGARFVVASRLHAAILALTTETPVLAISPARKVTRMMSDADLGEFCLDMPTFTLDSLLATAERIERSQPELRARIAAVTERARKDLSVAYDDVARLFERQRRHR